MGSGKSYLNFDLLVSDLGEQYQVRLIDSPCGQGEHIFSLPFSELELENFILRMGQNRGNVRTLHLESVDIPGVKKLGGALYDCIFGGDIIERFRVSQVIAQKEDKGLRIRLRLSGAPKLIDVPWELLFDTVNNNYIGLSIYTPIIRKLDMATSPRMKRIEGALKVLVMISSPEGYAQLDVEREWRRINTATRKLQDNGRVILKRLEPSLAALQRQLRQDEYHVFHYIGHGGFDRSENDGVLIMERSDKRGHKVSGQHLGTILHDEKSVKLALLNSCNGGRTSVTDPFAGVGQSLLQKGIPAVIAMQFEITDDAAITFSDEFYSVLVDGYPIDAAVTMARKMIYAEANHLEWATPVLYTSIDGGVLLDKREKELEKPRQPSKLSVLLTSLRHYATKVSASGKKRWTKLSTLSLPAAFKHRESGLELGILNALKRREPSSESSIPVIQNYLKSGSKLSVFFIALALVVGSFVWLWNLNGNVINLPHDMTLVRIPQGSFQMGSDQSYSDKPVHKVNIAYDFYMGATEVTFAQYDAYAEAGGKNKPDDRGWGRADRPVINVSWDDAQGYVKWLSGNNNKSLQCRLPSEAEWEYAARAGTQTAYSWGDVVGQNKANCDGCGSEWDNDKTSPVASFKANAFGLYDMHGNVFEWVQDRYHENYQGAPGDGSAWEAGNNNHYILRGGSWNVPPFKSRAVYRYWNYPNGKFDFFGFRVVCTP